MTSSCLLGVHHAMFAKTAGNEIEAIGSWDEVKWLAASGWRRRLGKRKSSQLDRAPFVTWSPTRGTWSDWKSSRNFLLETIFGELMRWNAALPTPPSPSISWPGNHDPLNNIPLCSSPPPLLLCSLVSLFVRQQRRIIHHYKQLLRSRSGPSPNPTSALKILNIIKYTVFVHICQVWLLFELRLSVVCSLDEFVAMKVIFGVLCGERNILNYFV